MREAEGGGCSCEEGSRTKGCEPPPEAGQGEEIEPPERTGPADTLILAQGDSF